jgi:hypothetical protein
MYLLFYKAAVKKRGRRNRTSSVLESVHWEVSCGGQTLGQPTADSCAPFSWLFAQFLGEDKKSFCHDNTAVWKEMFYFGEKCSLFARVEDKCPA